MFNTGANTGFFAILLAVMVEELGIPSPIPTDILIVMAGARGGSWGHFALWFVLISLFSAIGASGLYAAVRRGGRPLVARFGKYIHLGPKALARGEAILARSGWPGIVVGRATPGLRLPTVVACGLLGVPYRRFITAHITGTAVYILAFLFLGRSFGPHVLELINVPRITLHLIGILFLAAGLPLLLIWLASHAQINREEDIPPGRHLTVGAATIAALAGTATFAATWAAGVSLAFLANESPPISAAHWLLRQVIRSRQGAYLLTYVLLVVGAILLGVLFLEIALPLVAKYLHSLRTQSLALTAITFAFCIGLSFLAPTPPDSSRLTLTVIVLLLGSAAYAFTTVHARALSLALLPLGRDRRATRPEYQASASPTTLD